jgi:hypothetical protein
MIPGSESEFAFLNYPSQSALLRETLCDWFKECDPYSLCFQLPQLQEASWTNSLEADRWSDDS